MNIWKGLSILGNETAASAFWRRDFTRTKEKRIQIGTTELMMSVYTENEPIYGGGTYSKRNSEQGSVKGSDFYFTHSDPSRWQGIDTQSKINLAISDNWIERCGMQIVFDKYKEHFLIVDKYAPPYGLIDIASPDDAWAGMVYGSFFFANSPLHRWVEQMNWVFSGSKKGDRVRGVYWGNYFGPKILERLGGRESFLRSYRERARMNDVSPTGQIWEFENGVFVSISPDPRDCAPGKALSHPYVTNLKWLVRELGTHGLLNLWD